jgi:hypothetical protein
VRASMKLSWWLLRTGLVLSAGVGLAHADDWDGDDEIPTRVMSDLTHGSDDIHDLAAIPEFGGVIGPFADTDHAHMPQDPYSSWEVIVDGVSAQAGDLHLERMDIGALAVLQNATTPTIAGGWTRTLAWANNTDAPVVELIRVRAADCSKVCGKNARYRIRAYETTVSVARYNNSGTQVTVLLVQNNRATAKSGTVYFWSPAGALIAAHPFTLSAHALMVLNTSTVPAAYATSGSITIAHDAGYGGLNVKASVLEPATGFSFDTPGMYRPK